MKIIVSGNETLDPLTRNRVRDLTQFREKAFHYFISSLVIDQKQEVPL